MKKGVHFYTPSLILPRQGEGDPEVRGQCQAQRFHRIGNSGLINAIRGPLDLGGTENHFSFSPWPNYSQIGRNMSTCSLSAATMRLPVRKIIPRDTQIFDP